MRDLDEVMDSVDERYPEWLPRLERDEYAPAAQVAIVKLAPGDIINIRDLGIEADEARAYLTIERIHKDDDGMHGFSGKLPGGTFLSVVREDGVPMIRRRIVRYVRRAHI